MKWGKRKDRRGDLPSVRKIQKQIKKANKNPDNNKYTKSLNKKVYKEIANTKESKQYNNMIRNLNELDKYAKSQNARMIYTKGQVDYFNKVQDSFNEKAKQIRAKYIDQAAGAMLKDLGYEDTKAGRDFLKEKKLV